MSPNEAFVYPTTLPELEALHLQLKEKAMTIQAQLSQKRRYDPDGRMWTAKEYHEWRTSAVTANVLTQKRLGRVKALIKEMTEKQAAETLSSRTKLDINNPDSLLYAAWHVFQSLKREGVEFTKEEWAVIDAVRHYNERRPGHKAPKPSQPEE